MIFVIPDNEHYNLQATCFTLERPVFNYKLCSEKKKYMMK